MVSAQCIEGFFSDSVLQCRRCGFDPWVGKISWMKWLPTPVFLPGKTHGQRSLVGYSPWGHKKSDTAEQLTWFSFTLSLFTSVYFTSLT